MSNDTTSLHLSTEVAGKPITEPERNSYQDSELIPRPGDCFLSSSLHCSFCLPEELLGLLELSGLSIKIGPNDTVEIYTSTQVEINAASARALADELNCLADQLTQK